MSSNQETLPAPVDSIEQATRIQQLLVEDRCFATARTTMLEALNLRCGQKVLEVGCGSFVEAVDMSARVGAPGKVIGIDVTPAFLTTASRRCRGRRNLAFVLADASLLPCRNASFDSVLCDKLLIHVDRPLSVLREMVRVARPGGKIGALEWDVVGLHVTCRVDGFEKTYRRLQHATTSCPEAPRRLADWFRSVGLSRVYARLFSISSSRLSRLWQQFLHADLIAAVHSDLADQRTVERWWSDFKDLDRGGAFHAMTTARLAVGTVPTG